MRLNLITTTAMAAALLATGAKAADMPAYYEQPAAVEFGGWYLRGDVGISNQRTDGIDNALFADAVTVDILDDSFDASWFIGLGIGYQFNDYLRADITGEYRGPSDFHGLDAVFDGADLTINDYDTEKSEWTFLANAYWDFYTWERLTFFVGAGVGASYNEIGDLTDTNIAVLPLPGGGFAEENGEWQLAWALHAGLAFAVAPNIAVEVAYRYLHLGDAESGDIVGIDGTNDFDNPLEFDDLTSHDVKVGLRYSFQ